MVGLAAERGSVTVWLLAVPVLLLALCGVTLDLWAALSARSTIAAIADEAAVAGASAVSEADGRSQRQAVELDPASAVQAALTAVDTHPLAGTVTARTANATPSIVSVTVEGEFAFVLLRLVGATTASISVTGHARPVTLE
jgi:Flp pilus assembly protein TadG